MRPRVNDRIADAAAYPVTLIVAPAGFGKSVALRDYISRAASTIVRCDVRREESTLLSFARLFARSLVPIAPALASTFPMVHERALSGSDQLGTLVEWFDGHLREIECTIAIDDLHHAGGDPRSIALVVSLIERTSGRLRWIIATRSDAGLPLASWLAYGRLDVPVGENDLRFTQDEALAAAQHSPAGAPPEEIESLRQLTGGWPVAFSLAQRMQVRAGDVPAFASGTRELLYRYLAEQVFGGLSERARQILLETALVPSFSAALTDALGISREALANVKRDVGFLTETAPGVYRYHDLFRDYLESELQREGSSQFVATARRVAGALEASADDLTALKLFTRVADAPAIARILRRSGTKFFERGETEVLDAALGRLGTGDRREATMLGIKAMLESAQGHFELAERDFADAIERADDAELRYSLVHRYAIESIRHERDAISLLEPYADAQELPPSRRVPMLATLATALARAGRLDEAVQRIRSGIAAIDGSVDDDARARFYQQAAYVHHLTPSRGEAWNYANVAIQLALKNDLYDVAARAYSVLYIIVYDDEDDPKESLLVLDLLRDSARKAGSTQARLYGLIAAFELQVERGEDAEIDRLEREIDRLPAMLAQTRAETLLPARAMRAASNGDFDYALALLEGTGATQTGAERRALREAEIALYACASGRSDLAETSRTLALEALAQCPAATRRTTRTRVVLALMELVRGHAGAAHRLIAEAERASGVRSHRIRSLVEAARALYRRAIEQIDDSGVAAALQRLAADDFGGVARMLAALPFEGHAAAGTSYARLTAAERTILIALARGASSKDIARASERSAQTIDTHIRSICRKLQCSGRREAVALAIRSGWVES